MAPKRQSEARAGRVDEPVLGSGAQSYTRALLETKKKEKDERSNIAC